MKMYIANCTRQIQEFQFRRPESAGVVRLTIPVGGQTVIPIDLSAPEVDSIVDQHQRFGFVPARQRSKSSEYNSLCYSLDTPITMEGIGAAIEQNMEILEARGQKIREESALAINQSIENSSREGAVEPPAKTTVQIEEKTNAASSGDKFDETVVVDRAAPEPKRVK